MDRNPLHGSVIPFARRWHVIHEIDLVRLIEDQRGRLAVCDRAERIADALPQRPDGAALTEVLAARSLTTAPGDRQIALQAVEIAIDALDIGAAGAQGIDHRAHQRHVIGQIMHGMAFLL